MKVGTFSHILLLFILTMCLKIWDLAGKIENQSGYSSKESVHSVLMSTAYASSESAKTQDYNKKRSIETVTEERYDQFLQKEDILEAEAKNATSNQNNDLLGANDDSINAMSRGKERALNEQRAIANSPLEVNISDPKNMHDRAILLQGSNMSSAELKLLQELSKRKQKIDLVQEEISSKAKILKETEYKIDQKITKLKEAEEKLSKLVKQQQDKENAKLNSLVKIYENMKPQKAAQIFNELELDILLELVARMKENKVAMIISNMNASKAKDLSVELANHKSIEDEINQ